MAESARKVSSIVLSPTKLGIARSTGSRIVFRHALAMVGPPGRGLPSARRHAGLASSSRKAAAWEVRGRFSNAQLPKTTAAMVTATSASRDLLTLLAYAFWGVQATSWPPESVPVSGSNAIL